MQSLDIMQRNNTPMMADSMEEIQRYIQYPTSVQFMASTVVNVATNTTGQPYAGHIPSHIHLQGIGAPPTSTSKTVMVCKRKNIVSGTTGGIIGEESTAKLPGGRETRTRTWSVHKSHCKNKMMSLPMHQRTLLHKSTGK